MIDDISYFISQSHYLNNKHVKISISFSELYTANADPSQSLLTVTGDVPVTVGFTGHSPQQRCNPFGGKSDTFGGKSDTFGGKSDALSLSGSSKEYSSDSSSGSSPPDTTFREIVDPNLTSPAQDNRTGREEEDASRPGSLCLSRTCSISDENFVTPVTTQPEAVDARGSALSDNPEVEPHQLPDSDKVAPQTGDPETGAGGEVATFVVDRDYDDLYLPREPAPSRAWSEPAPTCNPSRSESPPCVSIEPAPTCNPTSGESPPCGEEPLTEQLHSKAELTKSGTETLGTVEHPGDIEELFGNSPGQGDTDYSSNPEHLVAGDDPVLQAATSSYSDSPVSTRNETPQLYPVSPTLTSSGEDVS